MKFPETLIILVTVNGWRHLYKRWRTLSIMLSAKTLAYASFWTSGRNSHAMRRGSPFGLASHPERLPLVIIVFFVAANGRIPGIFVDFDSVGVRGGGSSF